MKIQLCQVHSERKVISMKRTLFTDPYFYNQPPMNFVEELKKPLHTKAPDYYGKRQAEQGETNVSGLYIAEKFPSDDDNLLETVYKDFDLFLKVYGIGGDRFPIMLRKEPTECFEAYRLEVSKDKILLCANDTEGIRRGIIYLEDELRRSEGAFLRAGITSRKPSVKSRITRCFFSPINRPPKFGDELTDDVDYYPEEYLNRLMHDGANGVWIYTRFSDILPSSYIEEYGKGYEKRIEKLNRVIKKCKAYGIGVYVFAIEPFALEPGIGENHPDMAGDVTYNGGRYFCCSSEKGKKYCYEAGRKLLELAPELRGFISITYGERPTSCSWAIKGNSDYSEPKSVCTCPRCRDKKPGQILADTLEALRSGAREVRTDFETISWTYGHRLWEKEDIRDYVDFSPEDVILMQNFDDMGFEKQLGKRRLTTDYWLSYPGPSELFTDTAERAKEKGRTMYAKMQVCCSHEIATVPYVPVPGIIFDKYKGAYEYDVKGVMQCWYFGNYPSIMSKAAGELSFTQDFEDKDKFLENLAAIYFGRTKAKIVKKAWELFEAGYKNYPMNIMFSYYGPMHDSVVWKLSLLPKNFEPPRSWQLVDPTDGDRICDSLLSGHTLEEAYTLCDEMRRKWHQGMEILSGVDACHPEETEHMAVAKAIDILFDGGTNILEFYILRDMLGRQAGDSKDLLSQMKNIVKKEIQNSMDMIPVCKSCASLGFHSEAEGYKFFPEKIEDRIRQLEELLSTEFSEVKKRIEEGRVPLEYYEGIEDNDNLKVYHMPQGIENAPWENIGDSGKHKFRMAYGERKLILELWSEQDDALFLVSPEYRLTKPNVNMRFNKNGFAYFSSTEYMFNQMLRERAEEELYKYRNTEILSDTEFHLRITLDIEEIGLDRIRPMKMRFMVNEKDKWCTHHRPSGVDIMPAVTLGKYDTIPDEFGWVVPVKIVEM